MPSKTNTIKILAFDTATDALSVALIIAEGSKPHQISEHFELAPQRHAELILITISKLLQEAGLSLSDLDAIAFGRGPGSFMGVRIAAGVTQGLAFGLNIPVIPISTLQAIAQTAFDPSQINHIAAGWDARMNEIYWAQYQLNPESQLMELFNTENLSKPQDIIIELPNCLAAGNAWQAYQDELPKTVLEHFIQIKTDAYPRATSIARIALNQFKQGQVLPAEEAQPVYLRDKVTY